VDRDEIEAGADQREEPAGDTDRLPRVPNPHGIEYWGETVEMSDGSERPLLGTHDRTTGARLAAIEAYLIETRRIADEARANTEDGSTAETLVSRVEALEQAVCDDD
jgi:hypothetical protein